MKGNGIYAVDGATSEKDHGVNQFANGEMIPSVQLCNNVNQVDGETREMIHSVQMHNNVKQVVDGEMNVEGDGVNKMIQNVQNVQMNSQVMGETSEMIPSVQMCNQAKHVDGAMSEMMPSVQMGNNVKQDDGGMMKVKGAGVNKMTQNERMGLVDVDVGQN